jgi:hypothetical protein
MVESLEGRQLLSTLPPVGRKHVVFPSSLSHTVTPFIKHEPIAQVKGGHIGTSATPQIVGNHIGTSATPQIVGNHIGM